MPRSDPPDAGLAADRLPRAAAGGWVPEQPAFAAPGPPAAASVLAAGVADRLPLWARPWLEPAGSRGLIWLVALAVGVLLVSAWVLFPHRGPSGQLPQSRPAAAPVAPAPLPQIVVDVGGRVRRPGLVTLAQGARVADALRAAGGALRAADIVTLDLAARVSDGQLLLIGVPGAATGGTPNGATAPISLNSSTIDQLDALPGVGPVLARRIVDWRDAHGGFTTLSQLQQVPGVGPRTFERLKALVVV
jgi:competence protein ComEA